MNIFSEIHHGLPREGPGRNEATRDAFSRISNIPKEASVLDIGCGPGIHTIALSQLLKESQGSITAIDIHEKYLEMLRLKVIEQKTDNIVSEKADMFNLKYDNKIFDIIWAEGAIFIIGFERGLKEWKRLLKPDGVIVVSELSWTTNDIPKEISEFWADEYPGMQSVEGNIKTAHQCGYNVKNHFTILESAWFDDYYTPMENRINELKEKYKENIEAQRELNKEMIEINMYKKYSSYYGYEFYILQSITA